MHHRDAEIAEARMLVLNGDDIRRLVAIADLNTDTLWRYTSQEPGRSHRGRDGGRVAARAAIAAAPGDPAGD